MAIQLCARANVFANGLCKIKTHAALSVHLVQRPPTTILETICRMNSIELDLAQNLAKGCGEGFSSR